MKNEKAIEALDSLINTLVVVAADEEYKRITDGSHPIATMRITRHIIEMWEAGTFSVGLSIENAQSLLSCVSRFEKDFPYITHLISKINSIIED